MAYVLYSVELVTAYWWGATRAVTKNFQIVKTL